MNNPIKHLDLVKDIIKSKGGDITRYKLRYWLKGGGSNGEFRFATKPAMYNEDYAVSKALDHAREIKLSIKHINIVEG